MLRFLWVALISVLVICGERDALARASSLGYARPHVTTKKRRQRMCGKASCTTTSSAPMQAFAPTAWRRNAGPSLTIPRCVAIASAPSIPMSRSGRDHPRRIADEGGGHHRAPRFECSLGAVGRTRQGALVRHGAEAREAIAAVLGVPTEQIGMRECASPAQP
jgi:hypothetical protein